MHSSKLIFGPPVIFTKAPEASEISTSKRGFWIAFSTDSTARCSESDSPIPIKETPPFDITALTSAKSKFTKPEVVTSSVVPLTAFVKISSEILNAVCKGKSGANSKSLSFGITIKVSTIDSILSNPFIALSILFFPSIVKGKVTTPIVNAPCFFAIFAISGAAPVPVPPPIPQVIKIMSLPAIFFFISDSDSFAASCPILGLLPEPKPWVNSLPIKIFWSAFAYNKSCASVFIAINSPPLIPISFILLKEFPPPPPTPTTFILASCFFKSSANSISISFISGDKLFKGSWLW